MKMAGYIHAQESLIGSAETLQKIEVQLNKGHNVLVFPEGSRSPRNSLNPFHRGCFEIAMRTQTPILPIVIRTNQQFLHKRKAWYILPSDKVNIELELLPRLEADNWPVYTSRELSRWMRSQYISYLHINHQDT